MQQGVIAPYRILDRLGVGGMGVVYRARHLETGLEVALKTVRAPSQSVLSGIRREIRALASIRHPGIVAVLDEGIHEGMPWYAMEMLQGTTLVNHVRGVAAGSGDKSRSSGSTGCQCWWTSA